eukprot:CAMPEP_0172528152 /NCGR_PEP_ID=MMETSP1067-20121228/2630_1 /TAXON_ID=265564 ORGANISM="Thalassiosira punctigera, Strain Tpunct2005C2" /NCGR_SAMPLE_ID=MMETSP1067 /ASSEMBLY_ACC=CAM_ASM_000444 /LENGTH=1190 /DNA_ID=CAMNT_0013312021 /DNA_START=26 /DNA_END=3598 /DNA_ORIENTATION=+
MMDHDDDDDDDDHAVTAEGAIVFNDDDDETSQPAVFSLHTLPTRRFYLTRRGKILQSTTERYLRDDLGYGTMLVPASSSTGGPGGGRKKKSRDTIAGKINELVPWTMDDVSSLWNVLLSTTPSASWHDDVGATNNKIRLAVVDTNALLHHMDVLEYLRDANGGGDDGGNDKHHAIANAIVIPQTALEECRHRSLVMYRRATDLVRSSSSSVDDNSNKSFRRKRCVIVFADVHHVDTQIKPFENSNEVTTTKDADGSSNVTINDENDARLRKVAHYYGRALYDFSENNDDRQRPRAEVVFLSDDVQSRKLAASEQPEEDNGSPLYYATRSMRDHVTLLQREDSTLNLLDMVAQFGGKEDQKQRDGARNYYPPHVASSALSHGLQTNQYYQGVYRSDRDTYAAGYVTVRQGEDRVAVVISGWEDINRAVDGDIVAIELFGVERWLGGPGERGNGKDCVKEEGAKGGENDLSKSSQATGIAADTAEPSVRDTDNIAEEVPVDDEGQLRRPTGRVVGIIRRNFHKNYCGSICTIDAEENDDKDAEEEIHPQDAIAAKHEREHPDGITSTVVFFSIDRRVPPILLRTTQRDRLAGMRILVSMDSWPSNSEYPLGHYVKTLGAAGTKDTETEVLLNEFRIPCEPFPAKVLACLPPFDYKITLEPGRIDLRHLPVLSIDPPGCKDIDDALHCIELPNGNWQVGVHIADVTHYVEAGTAIDLEAANRSTSTYLVNKRLDMLPSLLTTDLCSLKGNVDRFAFTVLWEVTPEAHIVDVEFKKSIIHSIAALTYQQAQSLIDKPDKDCKDDIQAGAVKRLASLSRKFRARRIDAGALTLASPEVKFVLDSESLNPTDVQAYTLYEANALVEEFMLLANVTVAKKILRHYPTLSILRRHPAPNRSMFDGLIQKAKTLGVSIRIDDSKKLADSLDGAGKALKEDPYLDQLLRILSTRCMSPAQYFCSGEYQAKDWHHYGLAAPVYTHFTSPIRRYADVCVHRLLAAAIGVAPLPVFLSSKSHLHDLAANMNRRHRAAQLAGRASVQLHTLIFFAGGEGGDSEGGGAKEEDAYVLDVETSPNSEPSFSVMVPRYGIEGRVRLTKLHGKDDQCLVRDSENHRLGYKDLGTGKLLASVAVFDKVRVRIWVRKSRDRRELVVDLLEPRFLADPAAALQNEQRGGKEKKEAGGGSASKKKKKKQKTKQ